MIDKLNNIYQLDVDMDIDSNLELFGLIQENREKINEVVDKVNRLDLTNMTPKTTFQDRNG